MSGEMFFGIGDDGQPLSPEELARKHHEHHEQARIAGEIFQAGLTRVLCEELEPDDLEVLRNMFSHIADSSKPRAIANYYEGLVLGVIKVRRHNDPEPPDFG